jgi:hypothetical protein
MPRGGFRALFRGYEPEDQRRLIGLYKEHKERIAEAKEEAEQIPWYSSERSAGLWALDNGIARNVDYQRLPAQCNTINKTMTELYATVARPGIGGSPRLESITDRRDGQWNSQALCCPPAIAIGNETSIAGGRDLQRVDEHTIYRFDNWADGTTRHEFGHTWHMWNEKRINQLRAESKNWRFEFGVTGRSTDNWHECVAENFVLFSIGEVKGMEPKMLATFLEIIHGD